MKKILITHELPSGSGGLEFVVARITKMLKEHEQCDVKFILFDNKKSHTLSWLNGNTVTILKTSVRNKKLQRWRLAYKLSEKIASFKPNIILTLSPLACYISRYAIRCSPRNIKPKLVSWMHIPPERAYKHKYLTMADFHLSISEGIKNNW